MKKLYLLSSIIFLFLLLSCKSKLVNHSTGSSNDLKVVEVDSVASYFERNIKAETRSEFTRDELSQILSQLNINYNGDHIEDKLDVLLSKTSGGTKVTFQGKGSVGYSENSNTEISVLRKDIINHTDSLVQTITTQQNRKFEQFVNDWSIKNKEVKVKTFTPIVWLIIGLSVIVGMFLSWLSKQIKPLIIRK